MKHVTKFAENRYVKISAGLVLLLTTMWELVADFETGVQAEHGILFFSILHIVRIIPELQHAADELGS